jgi:putative tricarboxylic transport membrane protein
MLKEKNIIGAAFFFVIGLVSTLEGYRIKPGTISTPGAGFFPFYLGAILFVLSFFLFFKALRERRAREGGTVKMGRRWKRLLVGLAMFIVYVYALKPLGYIICGLLFLGLFVKIIEGRSWKSTLLISIICTLVSYVVFSKYLGVPLPKGIIPY